MSPPDPREIGALVALVEQDRLAEAESATRALLDRYPDAGMLWKILAVALVRQRRDALAALRRTVELMPEDAESHHNLGAALCDRGQWAEALSSLQQALRIQPDNAAALIDAANATRALGRPRDAVPFYERALRRVPSEAEAHNNLGNAYLDLKQYQDAEACYHRALQLKPDNAQIQGNLGQALLCMGRRTEAVACFQRVLELEPCQVDALNSLGHVLQDLGRRREALVHYARAVDCAPERADSLCNLGLALLESRRPVEGIACFRRALAGQPGSVAAHLNLAAALRQQHQADEAEASCQAALVLKPDSAEALALMGELRADRGQFPEAEALFQRAIAVDPDFAPAYFSIATHRRMRVDDVGWLRGATALLARPLPLGHQIGLHYALGKYFDDLRQYEQAFTHYHQANELSKACSVPYEADRLRQRVERIVRSLDAGRIGELATAGSDSPLPAFIVGMPRSGTSLLEQILASHPAVHGAGEITFWNAAYNSFQAAERERRVTRLFISGLARDYLGSLPEATRGTQHVVDKLPANFWYLGLIHATFPRARIIHIRRDPRDTCLSVYFQNFYNSDPYANDLEHLAHYYGQYQRVMRHWRAVLPPATLLELDYEALVADPERWSRQLLEFLGLPWDPRCLDFYLTDRVVITASKWQVRQKISRASVGRWRHYERFIGPLGLLSS